MGLFDEKTAEYFKGQEPGKEQIIKLSVNKTILEYGLKQTAEDIFKYITAAPNIKSVEISTEESKYDNSYLDILTTYKF